MRNIRYLLFLSAFFFAFLITDPLFATSRGIRVISKQGKDLHLYKDYHAIVTGISDYEHWPRLPNAVKDARKK